MKVLLKKIILLITISIIINSCINNDKKVQYYPNGTIKTEYKLINESINGEYIEYYENGKKKAVTEYLKGIKNGYQRKFYKNGKLASVSFFINGVREGKYLAYDTNGLIQKKGKLIHGKFSGFCKELYPNGTLKKNILMFRDNIFYSLESEVINKQLQNSEYYIDLLTQDTINIGESSNIVFYNNPKNYDRFYFVEGIIDTLKKLNIRDTIHVFNQKNDSILSFKIKPIKKGINYWSGLLFGIKYFNDTLVREFFPIEEQFYLR